MIIIIIIYFDIFIRILSLLAYNYKNGPWKFAYVKFGYDPV